MKTRISVIIPVYNVHEFLEECVDSVLAQTINNKSLDDGYDRNLQIILVDDGSTDNSGEMAKEYAKKHENIEYVYEENQGLGHARNYGCEFAEGDYIVFLDSDDWVPPKAYERMYNSAIRDGSDFVVGGVWRYNSRINWIPKIHKKVFSTAKEVTHISETPELFYDTTAWNKLIKRSFWEENEFKFPEGILYEDIPVTMPMHFIADKVSLVYETCYMWRLREGKSKSITQTTDEVKTLEDRLFVMGKVDEFFKENVEDPKMHIVKDVKWLTVDLMLFVEKLNSMVEEDSVEIISTMKEYIKSSINPECFEYLNEFDQLKYEYLMNDEFDRLVKLINFEKDDLRTAKAFMDNSHIMIEGDEEALKQSPFCIDKYVRENNKRVRFLQNVKFRKDFIQVDGLTVIPGLKDDDFADRKFSFQLINSETHKKVSLEHDDATVKNLIPYKIPFGNSFSYKCCGYKFYIPYSVFKDEGFHGENRIMVSFRQDDVTFNYFAGVARNNVKIDSEFKAKLVDDTYIFFQYDFNDELIINASGMENGADSIGVVDDKLTVHTPKYHGKMFLVYEKDSINPERKIELDYDEESSEYSIDMDEISHSIGQLHYENGQPVIHNKKEFMTFSSKKGQLVVSAIRDYRYKINKTDYLTTVPKIQEKGSVFTLDTKLQSIDLGDRKLKSAKLFTKDDKVLKEFVISEGEIVGKNEDYKADGEHIIRFKINFKDKNAVKNLYQGFHDVFAKYDFGDLTFATKLYMPKNYSKLCTVKFKHYRVYRSKLSALRIQVSRKWIRFENSTAKRKNNAGRKYELLRKLPIKKNRILFESWWGEKYHCNPRYLYEYIDKNHPEYECVWSLNDEHTPINGNGKRVRKNSLKYFYYLATSKYFVNNVNFQDHYVKRDGQIEIQTMHGTPLKTLGFDVPGELETKKKEENFIRRCDRWNYLLAQSDFVVDVTKSCYRYEKELIKEGYPRTDILFTKNNEKDINEIKERLGLPLDKKVILYAPTWRLRNKFDLMLDLQSFKKNLSDDYVLILRIHPFAIKGWNQPEEDDFVYDFSLYDSAEELYLVSDLLITDYSSVMFDYAILDRPIILFTYDMEEYKDKLRGMYIDIREHKPGPILYTSEDVEDAIINIEKTEEEYKVFRDKFREKFNQYENGESAKRIFERVFKK